MASRLAAIASRNWARCSDGRRPVVGEGRRGGGAGGVDVGRVAVAVGGLEFLACGGIEGTDLLAGTPNGFTGDEHLSRQRQCRASWQSWYRAAVPTSR